MEAKYQLLKYKYLFLYIIISSLVSKSCHYKSLQNTSVSVFHLTPKNYKVLSKNDKYQKSLHARQTEKKAFFFNSVKPSGPVKKLCQVSYFSVRIYSGVLNVLNHSWRQNTSTRHVKTLMLYLQANLPTRPLFSFIEQKGTWRCAAVLSETIYYYCTHYSFLFIVHKNPFIFIPWHFFFQSPLQPKSDFHERIKAITIDTRSQHWHKPLGHSKKRNRARI